jgi:glycolate oxidase iron-sulfur subunit
MMQTTFSPEQLQDPRIAEANQILRACVHCGFCTATCPSYQVLGDELDGPRGRIYQIKEMLENDRPADAQTVKHVDRCLSCLACMTTCPSGVNYMHLVDHARAHIERTYKRPLSDRLLRWVLAKTIPHPMRFRLALFAAKLARPFRALMPDKRLKAMLDMVPLQIPPVSRNDDPQTFGAKDVRKMRVALLTGCAQRALNTDINDATIRLLTRLGAEVVIPKGMGCCGSLTHHMGREGEAHASAMANIRAILAEGPFDAVVVNASGCGTTMKDYGHMFAHGPHAGDAAKVAGMTKDITEVVEMLGFEPQNPQSMKVAYHAACSLQHGQKIRDLPKNLLRQAGFSVSEPEDSHLCCGSAGTYNLLQPEISAELKARKVASIAALTPDVIAAGNIGCMMQIGTKAGVPVVHTAELLDWATGGPKPKGLP